jgi:hypothetical protein
MAFPTPTAIIPRQINVIIGSDPSATISSLSSALVTAGSNIATLSQQSQQLSQSLQQLSQSTEVLSQSIQQLQIRSAQDVQNLRSSAAVAMASISGSLAAVASAAMQSALAGQADANAARVSAACSVGHCAVCS